MAALTFGIIVRCDWCGERLKVHQEYESEGDTQYDVLYVETTCSCLCGVTRSKRDKRYICPTEDPGRS